MEVHGKVGPGLRRAGEDVHAVVQHAGKVGVHVREGVEEEQRTRGRGGEVARVEGRHGSSGPEPDEVVRPVRVEIPWETCIGGGGG